MNPGESIYQSRSCGLFIFRLLSVVWLLPIADLILNLNLMESKPDGIIGKMGIVLLSLFGCVGFYIAGGASKERHTFFEAGLFQHEKGKDPIYRAYEDVVLVECYYEKQRGDERTYHYYCLVFWFSDATSAEIRIQNNQEKLQTIWKQLISAHPDLTQRLEPIKGNQPSEQLYQDLTRSWI